MEHAIKKLYHSITEAAQIVDEEQHVLRYWEREFPQLRPQKNRAGNRVYTSRDLAILRMIKHLLREERYTVVGAKEHLKQRGLPAELTGEVTPSKQAGTSKTLERSYPTPEILDSGRHIVSELRLMATTLRSRAPMN